MIIKLFTQPNCGKCPAAKEVIKALIANRESLIVEEYDTTTVDGMAEASFYTVMATPTILVCSDDGKVIKDFRGEAPSLKDLTSAIS
jgi:thioredoxin-related protein